MSILKTGVNRMDNFIEYKKVCEKLLQNDRYTVACPICNKFNEDRSVFIQVYGFEYVQCRECKHVYIDLLPEKGKHNDQSRFVSERMSKQLYQNKNINSYRIENVAKPKVDFVLEHFPEKFTGRWLDVGCGTGEMLYIVKENNWVVQGIDNDSASLKFAKDVYGLDVLSGSVAEVNNDFFCQYDVISIFLLLEHIRNAKEIFKKICDGSDKGTKIVLEINNAESFSTLIQRDFSEYIDRHFLPCSHLNMFTHESLVYLMDIVNCKIISEWWFGQDFYELLVILNYVNEGLKNLTTYETLIEMTNSFQGVIDKQEKSDRLICIVEKM
jgi:2-polyprenyl-3-methyl-5-hydroxy-6-metoxy-1,4-benzoquinol methylase